MSDLISKKSKEDMLKEISELRSEITELKAANFELKSGYHKNTQKHKKNRNLFHSIFEDAGVGMAIINRNTEIVKFNRAFQDLFGYSTDELYRLSYFDMIPEQKKANAVKFIEALFAAKLDKFEGEEIYLKKDKSPIWLRLTTTVINDEFGIPEYIIGMGEDITDKIEY